MYESDYEDEAQFTEETLQDGLRELITEGQPARRHRVPADHRPEPLKHSGPG